MCRRRSGQPAILKWGLFWEKKKWKRQSIRMMEVTPNLLETAMVKFAELGHSEASQSLLVVSFDCAWTHPIPNSDIESEGEEGFGKRKKKNQESPGKTLNASIMKTWLSLKKNHHFPPNLRSLTQLSPSPPKLHPPLIPIWRTSLSYPCRISQ